MWLVFGGAGVSFTGRPDMILNPLGISHLFRNRDATDVSGWQDASGQFAAMSLPDVPTSAVALADFDRNVAFAGTIMAFLPMLVLVVAFQRYLVRGLFGGSVKG